MSVDNQGEFEHKEEESSSTYPRQDDGALKSAEEKVCGEFDKGQEEHRPTPNQSDFTGPSVSSSSSSNLSIGNGNIERKTVSDHAGDEEGTNEGDVSERDWKPSDPEALQWVNRQMLDGIRPQEILGHLLPNAEIPDDIDGSHLWHFIIQLLTEPPKRKKLPHYNTLEDAVELLKRASKILVITGAGVSVSCGIPDFRSKDGIYERLHRDFPDLPNPQAMFDIDYFRKNQRPFFDFAKEIYPGQFQPSRCHRFIKMLEDEGKLLRNYTQNIDTLEQVAGITRVVQCHGSFATASCCVCKYKVDSEFIKDDIMHKRVPVCPKCPAETEMAVMKPDIVFFGENLPQDFHRQIVEDKEEADLLIVIGSSMKVRPVALIPNSIGEDIPQIVIDRRVLDHLTFDIELLGHCDKVIEELCLRLGSPWNQLSSGDRLEPLRQVREDQLHFPEDTTSALSDPRRQEKPDLPLENSNDGDICEKTRISNVDVNIPPENGSNKMKESRNQTAGDGSEDKEGVNESLSADNASLDSPSEAKRLKLDEDISREGTNTRSYAEECLEREVHPLPNVPESSSQLGNCTVSELRAMYKPRFLNLASLVPESSYLLLPPNKSVFRTAEVYRNLDFDEDSSDSSDDDDDDGAEQEESKALRAQGGACDTVKSDSDDSSNAEYRINTKTSPQLGTEDANIPEESGSAACMTGL